VRTLRGPGQGLGPTAPAPRRPLGYRAASLDYGGARRTVPRRHYTTTPCG